jgi:hypothetical protein
MTAHPETIRFPEARFEEVATEQSSLGPKLKGQRAP